MGQRWLRRDGGNSSQRLIVSVLAFAGLGAAFMQTILIPIQGALPVLLDSTREVTAWVITATLLVSAICTPISGKLGDMYGKRLIACVLLGGLIAGSLVCAISPNATVLIIGRGLQGVGMGVIPLGISILRDTLPPHRLGSSIALVSATLGVGGALGLPVSALVVEHFHWKTLFWIASGVGATAFALIRLVVPPSTLRSGGRFDAVGAIGLAIGLTGLLLAISQGNDWGWAAPATLVSLGGGVLVLIGWGWYEMRQDNALVDIRISAQRPVLLTNLASVAMGFALFASSVVFPQLLELPAEYGGLGMTLLQTSLIMVPSGLAMLAMSPVAGRLQKRIGAKWLFVSAGCIIAVTYLFATVLDLTMWHVLVLNSVIGIGIGLGYAAMPTLIMQAVPSRMTGAANGLNALMRSLGTSLAAAAVAGVLARSAAQTGSDAVAPSAQGFDTALLLGFIAAMLSLTLAVCIPRGQPLR